MAYILSARLHEFYIYLRQLALRPAPPRVRFAIFSHPRSGSQLLRALVSQQPAVYCEGEVFLKFVGSRVLFPRVYLEGLSARTKSDVYGCILRQSHIYSITRDFEGFQRRLAAEGWKVVYLQRRDRLRLALSQLRAASSGIWHRYAPGALAPMVVDVRELRDQLRWIDQCRRHEERIMGSVPHLKVVYEDDLFAASAHQATADAVFAFLGLPSVPVAARTFVTTPPDLSQAVANWEEVQRALQQET